MKAQFTDFVPGRILYHVYGVNRTNTVVSEDEITKLIVIRKPHDVQLYLSRSVKFVDVITIYKGCEGEDRSYEDDKSLGDMGVLPEGKSPHNLNRAFTTKESALAFLQELRDDKFSDPADQEYAKNNPVMSEDEWRRSLNEPGYV